MPASIGVNLRVTGHCRQGGRKYMEDFFSVAYQQTEDEKDLEYAFFGIYDGHGGAEAAAFAKEHLMESIIKHKNFWSDYDEDVLRAIKDGYIATHYAMWREQDKKKWPRTASGLPSTAGTTASVAFIRRGKIYIGHVGDSGITLGYQEPGCSEWNANPLTRDHKPENEEEMSRIEQCGGKVVSKSGVPRVVWNRPKIGHQGPVRRSTPIDEIPFLAVARSLGDLWSYNSQINQFIVSPDPDCSVLKIDTNIHRCLIFGTDGLYNMLSPMMAVHIVQQAERHNENAALSDSTYKTWLNPSKLLVEKALEKWHATKMRADNASVVTLMLDPPGPPRAQVLKDRKKNLPERGLRIMTRFDGNNPQENDCNNCDSPQLEEASQSNPAQTLLENIPAPMPAPPHLPDTLPKINNNNTNNNKEEKSNCATSSAENTPVSSSDLTLNFPLKERNFLPKLRESTSCDPREPLPRPSLAPIMLHKAATTTSSAMRSLPVTLEVDSNCEDEGLIDSTNSRNGRHNLRSSRKTKNESPTKNRAGGSEDTAKIVKRKHAPEQGENVYKPRKSLRIDHNQKKAVETAENEKKASEAEEKLKKLAEQADLAKQKKTPLSITQKLLKGKPANKKQKDLGKAPLTKKKLQVALSSVRDSAVLKKTVPNVAQPSTLAKNSKVKQKLTKAKNKIMASKKVKLQRQSKQGTASQYQRNVKGVTKKGDRKVQGKEFDVIKDMVHKEKELDRPKGEPIIVTNPVSNRGTGSKGESSKIEAVKVVNPTLPVKAGFRRSLRSSTSTLESLGVDIIPSKNENSPYHLRNDKE
ncbi:hypothetical protein NQ317_001304 [Molorchus minor]|uniref:PPM-type phosphatase domain-containing protein n=1 Tax=Molorchus minor TaxID=1323400 RepID=A0ABQ9JP79_9CUCU|nr:hypothetical protein NQ317_001304 [Molorchus minor]